jgi:TolB protein
VGQIAFLDLDEGDELAVFVMNADGSGKRAVTNSETDGRLDWSPDGRRLAFIDLDENLASQVFTIEVDGSNRRQLTSSTDPELDHSEPLWSPDGSRLAYVHHRPAFGEEETTTIGVVDADGSNPRVLDLRLEETFDLAWSPDGEHIAFTGVPLEFDPGPLSVDVFVVSVSDARLTRLTTSLGFDGEPAWSPDGKRIAFQGTLGGESRVFVANAEGGNLRLLTQGPGEDGPPAWRP